MKTAGDIYDAFRIMPGLRLHQYRVAALARAVCRAVLPMADMHTLTLGGLFHDMGNIIKADLSLFPNFLEPEGREYWEGVKREYIETYGPDEEEATRSIARELKLPQAVQEMFAHMGFSRACEICDEGSLELQILEYADQRVSPAGVTSLEGRLAEGRRRYLGRHKFSYAFDPEYFEERKRALEDIERRLFEHSEMPPAALTEASIAEDRDALAGYVVSGTP